MKRKIFSFLTAMLMLGVFNGVKAQCNSIFTNIDGTSSFYQLTDPGIFSPPGTPLFQGGTCGPLWITPAGLLQTGDLLLFDVTPGNTYAWTTCGLANFDTYIRIWDAGTLTLQASNDDDFGCGASFLHSTLVWTAPPGVTQVWLSVNHFFCDIEDFDFSGNFGRHNYDLLMTCVPGALPPNDLCADAVPISCGDNLAGSTAGASFDAAGFCGTSNTAPGVWYSFTSPTDACVTMSTCNQADYDTKISVYTGGCGVLNCVTGQDDNFGAGCAGFTTELQFNASAGTEYLILVHGFGSASGNFVLSASCEPVPSNDNVCSAQNVAVGSTTAFDISCAGAQPGEVSPGAGTGSSGSCASQDGWCSFETGVQNSLWYTFQAPASGCVTIVADGGDTQLAMYSAELCFDYGSFSTIAANDDDGPGLAAAIVEAACLTPGATYWVQIDGFAGSAVQGNLTISDCGNDPLAADAGACQVVFANLSADVSCAELSASASGGFPPYSYVWTNAAGDTMGTDQSVVVCPGMTTDFTLVVTDDKGCEVSDDVTVNVVDIACGSSSSKKSMKSCELKSPGKQKVLVCVTSGSKGPKTKCKKFKSVTKSRCKSKSKSKEKMISLGPCDLSASYPDCEIASLPECNTDTLCTECKGGLASIYFMYVGPNGGTIVISDKCDTLAVYSGLNTGDLIDFDTSMVPLKSSTKSGTKSKSKRKLPGKLTISGVGAPVVMKTSCSKINDLLQYGPLMIGGWADNAGNECERIARCADLTLNLTLDSFAGETSWELRDGSGALVGSNSYSFVNNNTTVTETFPCLDVNDCYTFTIFDSFGDGICCFWGLGNYSIDFNGVTTASPSGGAFGSSESIDVGGCASPKVIIPQATSQEATAPVVASGLTVDAYPNPFTTTTNIKFTTPTATDVTLEVFNVTGAKVGTLFNGAAEAGQEYKVELDGSSLPGGVYFYTLKTADGATSTGKVMLRK